MNLVLDVKVRVGGVLAAADAAPLLTDAGGTFGVRRTDTGATVVAAGTAMSGSGGVYAYELAGVAPGVTYEYWVLVTLGGGTYRIHKFKTAPADITAASNLGVDEADALAATLPGLAKYKGADAAARSAALVVATIDIEGDGPYQGRKYDPAQAREFPRIAYDGGGPLSYALLPPSPALNLLTHSGDEVWDWDATTSTAVMPPNVKLATLFQADDALDGRRAARVRAIADGLVAQSTGDQSETYRADAEPAVLCVRAKRLMAPYRLRQGRLL